MRSLAALLLCVALAAATAPGAAKPQPRFGRAVRTERVVSPLSGAGVTIQYDSHGVPYISAASELDVFYGQGLVVGTNRLWQIEFWRRFMGGTLSEVFGEATLQIDISSRRMQWRAVCTENIKNTPPSFIANVEAYARGVNDFIAMCKENSTLLPPEFEQYGAPFPAQFQVLDTFFVLKGLSLGLANNAGSEIANQQQLEKIGMDRFLELNSRDPTQPPILPPYSHSNYSAVPGSRAVRSEPSPSSPGGTEDSDAYNAHVEKEIAKFKDEMSKIDMHQIGLLLPSYYAAVQAVKESTHFASEDSSLEGTLSLLKMAELTYASNNWVIAGEHTNTGQPILSSDPHLPYFAPSIWFLVGLNCTSEGSTLRDVFGVTVIGAPGIGIGRNEWLAWGITTNKADSQDFFEMQNTADDTGYYYKNQEYKYVVTKEQISVKGKGNVTETFLNSVYGPVSEDGGRYYSLSWAALYDTDTSLQGMYLTNVATTVDEWRSAASLWWGLLFNMAFADEQGNIAMQVCGKIPLRNPSSLGLYPMPGNGTFDWPGLIPFDEMPFSMNPDDGFLVSANNRPGHPDQLSNPMPGEYAPGFRAQRIIDRILDAINAQSPINVTYCEDIQADELTLEYAYLRPALERLQLSTSAAKSRQQSLLEWDGNALTSSKVATTFEDWVYCLWNVTSAELGVLIENPWLSAVWFNDAQADGSGDDPICSAWNETCLAYASACFETVVAEHRERRYGLDHLALFAHLPPFPLEWNRIVPVGGDHYTPDAATMTIHIPGVSQSVVVAGPSVRFVFDMSHKTPIQCVLPMGESGDPRSAHYDDQLDAWTNDQYYSMGWDAIQDIA